MVEGSFDWDDVGGLACGSRRICRKDENSNAANCDPHDVACEQQHRFQRTSRQKLRSSACTILSSSGPTTPSSFAVGTIVEKIKNLVGKLPSNLQ